MKRAYVEGIPQVVLCLKTLIKRRGSYLFIKRSSKLDYSPGLWDLPGGKLAVGEDINETLAREVKEETNLTVKPEKMNFYLEMHKSDLKNIKVLCTSNSPLRAIY
jgi:8-oxo-dGTP pyrophosphatase MutT (NUDIX family)